MDLLSEKMCLRKGDLVSLVATARKISFEEIETAVKLLESWGLNVLVDSRLFAVDNQFAGNDQHRAALLQEMIDNDAVRAIFCVRGGYGTVRMVDKVDFSPLRRSPKWIVGYSDVTVLHSHLNRHCGIPSLHAIMPVNITPDVPADAPALSSLHELLFRGSMSLAVDRCGGLLPPDRVGKCYAPVVGGNLSVLYSLLASDSDVDTDGKILLIEDLDEYLYHIDRMMMALKRAGKLDRLAGLIVGRFSDMHDNAIPFGSDAYHIVYDAVSEYDYPVCFNAPFGHIGQDNVALPLGLPLYLSVSEHGFRISL